MQIGLPLREGRPENFLTKGSNMATVDKMPMLAEGYERLQTEVRHLKMVERPAIIVV